MVENSPFDLEGGSGSQLDELELGLEEVELGGEEAALLSVRTAALALVVTGGLALVILTCRRKRGSWSEAVFFTLLQLIWQVLAWYILYIDEHWVHSLHTGTVDSEHSRKVYVFFENLFHGVAVYSGVALIGRLEGVVGALLWILMGMSVVAPLLWAIVILLLDLTLSTQVRHGFSTQIGVAAAKMVWLNLIPLGLVLSWLLGQCRGGWLRLRSRSTRETASKLVAVILIVFHLLHVAQFAVYCAAKYKSLELELASAINWLLNAGYVAAAVAIPWGWFIGLVIPRTDENQDQTELNLKLAKQNKTRNIVKLKKPQLKGREVVATPPNTPYKFQPEVTSSPSTFSQEMSSSVASAPGADNKLLATDKKSKRSSYLEAVSMGSLNFELPAPPTKAKSADPLWLPESSARSLQV